MRDIIFRGMSRKDNKWIYGLPKYGSGGSIDFICGWMGEESHSLYDEIEVFPDTIGQFTGIKDVDMFDVFEGDILRSEKGICISVSFYNGAFRREQIGYKYSYLPNAITHSDIEQHLLKVIGNIHEHRDLL